MLPRLDRKIQWQMIDQGNSSILYQIWFKQIVPWTFNKGINMQTMNQHKNNVNGSVVSMSVHANQDQ
jgi:hypothetical protein